MSIETLCEKLNIKGLVTYTESPLYLSVCKNGVEYVYNKKDSSLMVISKNNFKKIEKYAWQIKSSMIL